MVTSTLDTGSQANNILLRDSLTISVKWRRSGMMEMDDRESVCVYETDLVNYCQTVQLASSHPS